jgi:ABC-type transport system substrate-binding protein
LYRDLARPFDQVVLLDGTKKRISLPGRPATGKEPRPKEETTSFVPYEEAALKKVNQLLAGEAVEPLEKVNAAEEILAVVFRFHLAFRQRPASVADPWKGLQGRLAQKLLEVRLQRLRLLAAGADQAETWARALEEESRLRNLYPKSQQVEVEAAGVWARHANNRLKAGDFPAARASLEQAECLSRDPPGADDLRRALQAKAEALQKEAVGLEDQPAAFKLEAALKVWPRLPGLRDELLKRRGAYPVLRVGVRSLPDRLSPASAWSDQEKQAVELLFERLIRGDYDGRSGEGYRPELGAAPQVVSGGRRVHVGRNAHWSDGHQVTAMDVRHTAHLLNSVALPWRTPEWMDLVELPDAEGPFSLDFRFRQAFFDPLAPLSFHVLPQVFAGKALVKADDPAFARSPLGSGPFQYGGRKREHGREYVVFTANPHYQMRRAESIGRPGNTPVAEGLPGIREIRFFVPRDPAQDFKDSKKPLHLLLDLPTEQIAGLQRAGFTDIRTLKTRRVWFLAINHRLERMARSKNLRRALGLGIDREAVLNACFRGGHPSNRVPVVLGSAAAVATAAMRGNRLAVHCGLNGPFPAGSWACAPSSRLVDDLLDPEKARDKARVLLAGARDKDGLKEVELTLKYPNDDPRVDLACREMARQLAVLGEGAKCPIPLKLLALSPDQLRHDLERRDFELAYHHHDFASEAYWLWPLFDSRAEALRPGGSNYLGYHDADLEGMLRDQMAQRDFARVRKLSHDVHAHLVALMPFIPLWQLDTHIAVHPDLTPIRLDPLVIFGDVAHWRLKTR